MPGPPTQPSGYSPLPPGPPPQRLRAGLSCLMSQDSAMSAPAHRPLLGLQSGTLLQDVPGGQLGKGQVAQDQSARAALDRAE